MLVEIKLYIFCPLLGLSNGAPNEGCLPGSLGSVPTGDGIGFNCEWGSGAHCLYLLPFH